MVHFWPKLTQKPALGHTFCSKTGRFRGLSLVLWRSPGGGSAHGPDRPVFNKMWFKTPYYGPHYFENICQNPLTIEPIKSKMP